MSNHIEKHMFTQ